MSELEASARRLLEAADREATWLSVKEYAALRRVHVQTVYSALRYRPEAFPHPFERIGRAIRIDVSRGSIEGRRVSYAWREFFPIEGWRQVAAALTVSATHVLWGWLAAQRHHGAV